MSTRKRAVKDGKAEDATRQPEQVKAFRDTWQLGIHSYLAYLRDRLAVARELLTETGSIFVQIGDENVHLVRCVMDEVFGSENFVSQIAFKKTGGQSSNELPSVFDYLLWYARNREVVKYRQLYFEKQPGLEGAKQYTWLETPTGERRPMAADEQKTNTPAHGEIFQPYPLVSIGESASDRSLKWQGDVYRPSPNSHWKTTAEGLARLALADRILAIGKTLRFINYLRDYPTTPYTNIWTDTQTSGFAADRVYVVQTLPTVIERCLLMTTDPGDLVLDPTCGSGTTAHVAEQWGRRWITIDTSRVAVALARTRLMAARYPYYVLADSPEGLQKEAEVTGQVPPMPLPKTNGNIKHGFVYQRVPHVTLKAIAHNDEIDIIHVRWQERLELLCVELNRLLKRSWKEWEIPCEVGASWPAAAQQAHAEWWRLRRERQQEIDDSIARRADVDLLYDQPYEDNKRIRVAGPFTVESLSPHRVLATDEERPASETEGRAQAAAAGGQFETMIIENLKKAGVQNTRRDERLRFDRLEPYAGVWLHAAGEYTERPPSPAPAKGKGVEGQGTEAKVKRVAVSIGPEHGTVGSEQVKEAAKEALRGVGFDLLVICGFSFDALAGETAQEFAPPAPATPGPRAFAETQETRQYGKLPILLARMNPDLTMGDELLKKTGAGNLFMVFGEPDLAVEKQPDGKLVVTIHGVDVYDPTTGQIRSSSTDDIACWFIDTEYNGESFFVRHAYFTGAGDPYDRLKRALRAEINEAAWAALYSTTSYPFDPPKTGKIAVKVINHYGDEVLKVYEV